MKKILLILFSAVLALTACRQTKRHDHGTEPAPRYLRLSISDDPSTVDSRKARDLNSSTALRMLFEGLMRPGFDGTLEYGMANSVEASPDLKTYTFTLRDAKWSNGDPVTSSDFAYAWRTILSPTFPAPNAYQLYIIKGGREAKENKKKLEELGIYTPDKKTLVVELEKPCPYFLELTSFHAFFPVNQRLDTSKPDWSEEANDKIVGNGPFVVEQWIRHNIFSVKKNPLYWDAEQVKLDKITLFAFEENTAMQVFESNGLDWVGSPLSLVPADAMVYLKENGSLETALAAGTQWVRVNTSIPAFGNSKIRKALALAIDRTGIVRNITQGCQIPATGIVPPQFALRDDPYFDDHDLDKANQLFLKGLAELNMKAEEFPSIVFSYGANDRSHKIAQAIQQQWESALPVTVKLQSTESKVFFSNVAQGNYQLALGSWFADFRDPINFLEIFKSRDNRTNSTFWENLRYSRLLDQSSTEGDPSKRKQLLLQAEEILVDEMPVIPIYHYTFNYIKSKGVGGVLLSDLGFMDFKYASNE